MEVRQHERDTWIQQCEIWVDMPLTFYAAHRLAKPQAYVLSVWNTQKTLGAALPSASGLHSEISTSQKLRNPFAAK
jgi:hypothetical protein